MTHTELMWRNADMWQSHGGRHRPTWAPMWREDADEAKSIGPMGIVGPGKRIGGGRTKPVGATQRP